jgi:hypothetical protein
MSHTKSMNFMYGFSFRIIDLHHHQVVHSKDHFHQNENHQFELCLDSRISLIEFLMFADPNHQ